MFTHLYVHVYKGVNNQKIIVFIFKTYSHFTHQLVVLLDIYHEVWSIDHGMITGLEVRVSKDDTLIGGHILWHCNVTWFKIDEKILLIIYCCEEELQLSHVFYVQIFIKIIILYMYIFDGKCWQYIYIIQNFILGTRTTRALHVHDYYVYKGVNNQKIIWFILKT